MKNGVVIFEDEKFENFYPLTHLRPVYFLRPGIRFLFEKIVDDFEGYKPFLFCRPELADITSEMTKHPVNDFNDPDLEEIVFVNGRVRHNRDFMKALKEAGKNAVLYSGDNLAAFKAVGKLTPEAFGLLKGGDLGAFLDNLKGRAQTLDVEVPLYNYLWEMVSAIREEIADDFEYFRGKSENNDFLKSASEMKDKWRSYPGIEYINVENLYVASDAELLPGIVLDASKGPIFVGRKARIEPHTYIVGPTYIGKESIAVGGRIAESSVGPVCRVGGELEATIIQGYTNKYHAGFVGHSYLGEWINLGAMTTNSDLKNNYANVVVSVDGKSIDTETLKVGSFIGDFVKTSIGCLLNTGINIGVACNVISGELVVEREIPPFTWYSSRHKMDYNFVKSMAMIEKTMSRRGMKPGEALKKRLREISDKYRIQKG
jgi:UDP-N-acetylglucosamine diphosphorylase/glucosamine-1-phosphate N-acetyltransferase